jgi:hypothetical protein
VTKIPDNNNVREDLFILPTVSEVSICHGREGMVKHMEAKKQSRVFTS